MSATPSTPVTPTEAHDRLIDALSWAGTTRAQKRNLIAESEARAAATEKQRADDNWRQMDAIAKAAQQVEAERDQLRAERDRLRDEKWEGIHALEQRAEKAEAEVERLKARLHKGCDDERDMAISEGPWHGVCGLADELTARAERAEAELAQEKAAHAGTHMLLDNREAELATERARLDWLANNGGGFAHDEAGRGISTVAWGDWATRTITPSEFRSAIDAAMKEGGK